MQFANKISLWILITFIDYCSRISFKGPLPNQKREKPNFHRTPSSWNFHRAPTNLNGLFSKLTLKGGSTCSRLLYL